MATDVATSIEMDVPPHVAWEALQLLTRSPTESPHKHALTWHFMHADVAMRSALQAEGASGSTQWDGVEFRVSAHLVPTGDRGTLLVLTAAPNGASRGPSAAAHVGPALRHARGDLRALAEAVAEQVAAREESNDQAESPLRP